MTHTQYLRLSLDTMFSPTCLWLMDYYRDGVFTDDDPIVVELAAHDIVEGYLFTREGFTEDQAAYAGVRMA